MQQRIAVFGLILFVSSLASAALAVAQSAPAQATTNDGDSAPHVVLRKLSPPVYPPLARLARTAGDVSLYISVHSDGSIESVSVISGNPMLVQAAIDSAKQSQFECRGCSALTESQSLTYSFRVSPETPDRCCCSYGAYSTELAPTSQVTQSEGPLAVTITIPPVCICPDTCTSAWAEAHSRFRSPKCLYLWKCGIRHITLQ